MIKVLESKIDKSFEKGPIRRSLFSNGAVSLFHQFKGMSSATVSLYFLAGSIFESEDNQGIAHLIEHMLFKETKTSNLIKELEQAGASINAYTYKDYVCFELDCSAKKLSVFLPKFMDLFLNPVFDEKALFKEKKVVIQEIKEDLDNHELTGLEYTFEKMLSFKLGHNIAGKSSIIRKLTDSDLHRYYKKYFTPQRMILSITSGSEFSSLEKIISNSFKKAKESGPWRFKKSSKLKPLNHFKSKLKRDLQSNIIFLGYQGVSLSHRDYYAYSILDDLLFEGMSSIFYQALRENKPLVYGLGSDLHSFVDNGVYLMIFSCQKSKVDELLKVVNDELLNLRSNINLSMIDSVKKRLIERWELGFDSLVERNEFIAHSEIYSDKDFSLKKQIESLESINSKDIAGILDKLIYDKNSQLIMGA